jgi:ubiquinone biosynthesis protein
MIGRLDDGLKSFLTDLLHAVVQRDTDEIVSLLLASGDISDGLDIRALKRDLAHFIDSYYEIPLKEIEVGRLLMEFVDIITLYAIHIPPDLMLLNKSLVLIEAMGRSLDPTFNMIDHLRPFIAKELRQKYSPRRIAGDIRTNFISYLSLARSLPRDIKEIINRINRNKFKIDLEHRGLDKFTTDFDRSTNRLSISLILSAMIIGSSIIMHTDKGPLLFGFPVLAFFGYTVAAFIGLWLVYAIIRSGRM